MYKIQTYNTISEDGLFLFKERGFEVSDSIENPDAIILRSHQLTPDLIPDSVKVIGRAGAGVNNIPVDHCSERCIVVSNAPGANANAVKELVITALLLSSRDIVGGVRYLDSIRDKNLDVVSSVEKQKSQFKGVELNGRTLGVVGLGAIGMMVANAAVGLGMNVFGHDPFISVQNAWRLSRSVKPVDQLNRLLMDSDYVTLHMPLIPETHHFLNKERFSQMKDGAVVLNFSRSEIVNEDDILDALESNKISRYVTDFPTQRLLDCDKVLSIPHLGASTTEAENNCSVMVANQIVDYLLSGNVVNSVNYPGCTMPSSDQYSRLTITNRNIPKMLGQVTSVLADYDINIMDMLNKSRDDIAYTIVDAVCKIPQDVVDGISAIDGVLNVQTF